MNGRVSRSTPVSAEQLGPVKPTSSKHLLGGTTPSSLDKSSHHRAIQCLCVPGVAVGISTGIFVNGQFWDSPAQASVFTLPVPAA